MVFAATLPLTVLLILVECGVGGLLVLLFTDVEGNVSSGFLITSGLILAADVGIAYLLKFGYGAASSAMGPILAAFLALVVAYIVLVIARIRVVARPIGVVAVVVGGVALAQSAALQPNGGGIFGIVSVALATWVAGAALTALLLGHWYLVTPLLSARSLRRVTEVLLVGLALQSVFLLVEIALSGSGSTVSEKIAGMVASYGFVFWFRVLVGLIFPIVLGVLTWRSCRLRAMQTATGFLYIVVGCVLAGDAAAKVYLALTSISL
jgi:hypothetical protein